MFLFTRPRSYSIVVSDIGNLLIQVCETFLHVRMWQLQLLPELYRVVSWTTTFADIVATEWPHPLLVGVNTGAQLCVPSMPDHLMQTIRKSCLDKHNKAKQMAIDHCLDLVRIIVQSRSSPYSLLAQTKASPPLLLCLRRALVASVPRRLL